MIAKLRYENGQGAINLGEITVSEIAELERLMTSKGVYCGENTEYSFSSQFVLDESEAYFEIFIFANEEE